MSQPQVDVTLTEVQLDQLLTTGALELPHRASDGTPITVLLKTTTRPCPKTRATDPGS